MTRKVCKETYMNTPDKIPFKKSGVQYGIYAIFRKI